MALRAEVLDVHEDLQPVLALREEGWFVATNVAVDGLHVDFVAIGPPGLLVGLRQRTDASGGDSQGEHPRVKARRAGERLGAHLQRREVAVRPTPAVLGCGPGQPKTRNGVMVIDGVAVLFADASDHWKAALRGGPQLADGDLEAAIDAVSDILEA